MMRLPKPAETNVTHDRRHIGSVYTAEQMRKYAAKAVAKEREACANVCDDAFKRFQELWKRFEYDTDMGAEMGAAQCAKAIRERKWL